MKIAREEAEAEEKKKADTKESKAAAKLYNK